MFVDIRKILKDELFVRIEHNPSYSLRAFGRDLNVDHGTLSQIISGKRPLTKKNYDRMKHYLPLNDQQKKTLEDNHQQMLSNFTTYEDPTIIGMDKWYYSAILELMDTRDFEDNSSWIADQLSITLEEVDEALDALQALNMVGLKNGVRYATEANTSTLHGTEMKNLALASAVQNVQSQYFQKQTEAFETFHYTKMSHYGLTLALSPKDLPVFREKLVTLMRDINRISDKNKKEKEVVYRLNLSLFPISKLHNSD